MKKYMVALLLIGVVILTGCGKLVFRIGTADEGLDMAGDQAAPQDADLTISTQAPIVIPTATQTPTPTMPPPPDGSYTVIVREGSSFEPAAERFAEYRYTRVVTYQDDFDEVLVELRQIEPVYTAVFATPEELTSDFIDAIDASLREIDSDPYLDTAFGIITARSTQELDQYVERLLYHVPVPKLKIYGATPIFHYINLSSDHGIEIYSDCVLKCDDQSCTCIQEHWPMVEALQSSLPFANVLVLNGPDASPSCLELYGGEQICGSPDGLIGHQSVGREQQVELLHDTVLTIAEIGLTGRINGSPSNLDERFDVNTPGQVDTSFALSILQSGTLNFIASTHVANSHIEPRETLIEESLLQGVPIGVALKDLKNRYIMVTESYDVSLPGAPVNTDRYTRDFVLFQVRNWILFGDPSIVVTEERHEPVNCVGITFQGQFGNEKDVEVRIRFEADNRLLANGFYVHSINLDEHKGVTGADLCVLKVPYTGTMESVSITPVSGVRDRYQESAYPANAFYQDLGDEILIQVPWFVRENLEDPIVLRINILTSPDA